VSYPLFLYLKQNQIVTHRARSVQGQKRKVVHIEVDNCKVLSAKKSKRGTDDNEPLSTTAVVRGVNADGVNKVLPKPRPKQAVDVKSESGIDPFRITRMVGCCDKYPLCRCR
jgi:hypothetical protein